MNFDDYIGYPVNIVKQKLDSLGLKYKIVENCSNKEKFDTIIVVRITQDKDGFVELLTDKFLINI